MVSIHFFGGASLRGSPHTIFTAYDLGRISVYLKPNKRWEMRSYDRHGPFYEIDMTH